MFVFFCSNVTAKEDPVKALLHCFRFIWFTHKSYIGEILFRSIIFWSFFFSINNQLIEACAVNYFCYLLINPGITMGNSISYLQHRPIKVLENLRGWRGSSKVISEGAFCRCL